MSTASTFYGITLGATVIGFEGRPVGTVEAVRPGGIRVAGHDLPTAAIARVEAGRVHLFLANAVLRDRRDQAPCGVR
jgi:hypothetical protein